MFSGKNSVEHIESDLFVANVYSGITASRYAIPERWGVFGTEVLQQAFSLFRKMRFLRKLRA